MITDMKDAKIFSPLQLGRTTLKNRIAMAPMSMHYEATNGTVPKQLADIFVRRAEGGAGYVVIDAVTVDHKYWYIGKTTALEGQLHSEGDLEITGSINGSVITGTMSVARGAVICGSVEIGKKPGKKHDASQA